MRTALLTCAWALRHPLYALSWALFRQPYSTVRLQIVQWRA